MPKAIKIFLLFPVRNALGMTFSLDNLWAKYLYFLFGKYVSDINQYVIDY
jgi:hypothetical protein